MKTTWIITYRIEATNEKLRVKLGAENKDDARKRFNKLYKANVVAITQERKAGK